MAARASTMLGAPRGDEFARRRLKLPNLRLPVRLLRGHVGRLFLTLVALASGVALVCAIDVVNRAVLAAFVEVVDTMAGRAALEITAGEGGLFPEDVTARAASVSGVETAVPVVTATAFTTDASGEVLTIHGVDITNESDVRVYQVRDDRGAVLDDPLAFLNQPDSIIVPRSFTEARGLRIGDPLELETPTGRRRFVVRALMDPEGIGRVHGGAIIVMDLFAAERAFTKPGFINRIDVVVARDAKVETVRPALAAALPAGLHVEAPAQRKVDLYRIVGSVQVMLNGVAILVLFAAFLIVFNRLSAVFEAKVWQVGVMRAMGMRAEDVWLILLLEALLIGIVGTFAGVVCGVALARSMQDVIATTTALASKVTVPPAPLIVGWRSLALATVLGIGATAAAAAIPAWRAARVPPAAVLAARGIEQRPEVPRLARVALICVALASVATGFGEYWTRSAGFGLATTVLITLTAAFGARLLVELLCRRGALELLGRLGPTFRFAQVGLTRSSRRAALTIGTLAVGFAVVTWLWILATSVEQSVTHVMPGIFRADLIASSVRVVGGYVEAPLGEIVMSEIATVPGVVAVAGDRAVDWHYADGPIAINAVDARFFRGSDFERWPLVGRSEPRVWESIASGDGFLISSNMAHNLDVSVGDSLDLDTPAGPVRRRVVGMVHDFLSPRGTVLMSRQLYARQWNDDKITHVLIRTSADADVASVRTAIAKAFGSRYGLRILSTGELIGWFAAQVRQAFAGVYILAVMVMLVVGFGIADTVATGVLERQRELGAMAALGVRRSRLGRMILIEASLIGIAGMGLALATGFTLALVWVNMTFPDLVGWILELHVPGRLLAGVTLLAIGVCIFAGAVPAIRSARVAPGPALRYE